MVPDIVTNKEHQKIWVAGCAVRKLKFVDGGLTHLKLIIIA